MASGYEVVSVVDRVVPDGHGSFKDVTMITYQMSEGYRGSVQVDKKDITPAKVKAAIDSDVATYRAIYGMKG